MPQLYDDKDRTVIPRWREFATTLKLGELDHPQASTNKPTRTYHGFDERFEEWTKNPTIFHAADLLGCAIVVDRVNEVRTAVDQILGSDRVELQLARNLANRVIGNIHNTNILPEAEYPDFEYFRKSVRRVRQRLSEYSHNAVLWVDLARHYENLGLWKQSERCMSVALNLCPDNRFVLRAAARLFVHHHDVGHARHLLQNSSLIKNDPWLLAAEIALSSIHHKTSKFMKTARRAIENERYSPLHLSELRSSIATLEVQAGNVKRCRTLLEASLDQPTENAAAQAAWISRQFGANCLPEVRRELQTCSPEAEAWRHYSASKWKSAIGYSLKWFVDQPFSSRPAILASYLAGVSMGNYELSAQIAELGLTANPLDFTLLNNAVFAMCEANKIEQAVQFANRVDEPGLSESDATVWLATRGLLNFRQGNAEQGELLYQQAINRAGRSKDSTRLCLAKLFFIQELLRTNPSRAVEMLRAVSEECERTGRAELKQLHGRITENAKTIPK